MFIIGGLIYWNQTPGQKNTGFDLLIIGSISKYFLIINHILLYLIVYYLFIIIIVLLPGLYSFSLLLGSYMGWQGYGYEYISDE